MDALEGERFANLSSLKTRGHSLLLKHIENVHDFVFLPVPCTC